MTLPSSSVLPEGHPLGGGQFRVVALSLDLEIVTVQAGLDEIAAAFSSLEEVGAIA